MNKYALIIGIENYSYDSNQSRVRFARNDALAMADYAEHAGFQLMDGPVLDEQATLDTIIDAIDLMFNDVNADDFVFIYYAGHGYHTEYGGYIIPYGHCSDQDISEKSCLPYTFINKRLRKKKPRKFIFFLDTCNSGSAVWDIDLRQSTPKDKVHSINDMIRSGGSDRFTGRVLFTSSLLPEKSRGVVDYHHGLFTYHLLCALKSKPDRAEIDMEELVRLTKEYVLNDPGQAKMAQTPVAYTNIQGKFLIPTYNKGNFFIYNRVRETTMNNKGYHKKGESSIAKDGINQVLEAGNVKRLRISKAKLTNTELNEHELPLAKNFPLVKIGEAEDVEIINIIKSESKD